MKRLVFVCVSSPPHQLLVPDVVKHVQLRQRKKADLQERENQTEGTSNFNHMRTAQL